MIKYADARIKKAVDKNSRGERFSTSCKLWTSCKFGATEVLKQRGKESCPTGTRLSNVSSLTIFWSQLNIGWCRKPLQHKLQETGWTMNRLKYSLKRYKISVAERRTYFFLCNLSLPWATIVVSLSFFNSALLLWRKIFKPSVKYLRFISSSNNSVINKYHPYLNKIRTKCPHLRSTIYCEATKSNSQWSPTFNKSDFGWTLKSHNAVKKVFRVHTPSQRMLQ